MAEVFASDAHAGARSRVATAVRGGAARELAPGIVAGGMTAALAFHSGGYYPDAWGWGALAFAWVAAVALALDARAGLARRDLVFLGALAALLGWVALSTVWSASVPSSILEVERLLVYLTAALAVLLLLRRGSAASVFGGLLAAVTAASGWGLATRLFPERFGVFDSFAGIRLFEPVGYWNGLGIFAVMGIVLGVGFGARGSSRAGRALAGAALPILAATLFFTFSRGAWIALGIALAAALVADARRLQLCASLFVLAPAPALAVWLSSRSDALTHEDAALAAASREGHRLAAIVAGLAILGAVSGVALREAEARVRAPRAARRAWAGVLVALLVAAVVAVTVRYGAPHTIVSRAWDSFTSPPAQVGEDLTRRLFNLSANGRIEYAEAAVANYREHPVLGSGAGTYEQALLRHRDVALTARDAHNVYLEALSELGPIGLALLVVALAVPLAAGLFARGHPLATAGVAAYAAFLAHAAVDWDWEVPAITVTALLVGTSLLALARRDREPRPLGRLPRGAALAALAAVCAFAFVTLVGNSYLAAGREALDHDRPAEAREKASAARGWVRWSSEPWALLGQAQLAAGELGAARASLRTGIEKDPANFELWLDLVLASEGEELARAYLEARRLNPLSLELAELEAAAAP